MRKKMIYFSVAAVVLIAAGFLLMFWIVKEKKSNQEGQLFVPNAIRVEQPLPDSIVKSPLDVKGEAVGTWFFEASFPVKITDANGNVLGQVPAKAGSDWMTSDFVPFSAALEFATSSTRSGFLIFHNDNPSGLPQNDKEVKLPVYFY